MAVVTGAIAGSMLWAAPAHRVAPMSLSTEAPRIGAATLEETLDPIDEEAVSWAQDRFREAGLSLPDIVVSFHRETDPCEGASGGHLIENGQNRVLICISRTGTSRELQVKRVLLHEFAHAWDDFALTAGIRSEFMDFKDFSGWSFDVPYDERASEHAAEIITWGLIDRPIMFGSLDGMWSWEEMLEGYRILTGATPPHGYVWTLFAASHDIYAHTASQIEIVKKAWKLSEGESRLTEWIEVRFERDGHSCSEAVTSSELIGERLHIQACPASESELIAALLNTLTGG